MNTNIQISLDEQLWAAMIRVGKPLGLEPGQVVRQALLGWLSQHDGQRFEQEWIAALKKNPDDASRAEDWIEARQPVTQSERSAVVAEVCGKYAALAPNTEKFMAQKREEIELEERHLTKEFSIKQSV